MAVVVNKTTMEMITSANTWEYSLIDWWKNPILPACDRKYWKNDSDTLSEMNQTEKDAVDAAEAAAAQAEEDNQKDINGTIITKLEKTMLLFTMDEVNILRALAGKAIRDNPYIKQGMVDKYDSL